MARLLSSALVLFALLGCKRAAAPVLKDAPPANLVGTGWTPVRDAASGVSLALPPGWRIGVARTLDASSLMGGNADLGGVGGPASEAGASLMRQDEELEKKELARMREKDGIVLHCTDGSKPIPAEEPTRLYVKRIPDAGYGSLDDAVAAEKAEAHRTMQATPVDLPIGKAVRLKAQGQNRIGDEECHVSYVFVDGKDAYVLRFASTNNPTGILGIERGVAETFRVAKK